jgi:hypothetical protein
LLALRASGKKTARKHANVIVRDKYNFTKEPSGKTYAKCKHCDAVVQEATTVNVTKLESHLLMCQHVSIGVKHEVSGTIQIEEDPKVSRPDAWKWPVIGPAESVGRPERIVFTKASSASSSASVCAALGQFNEELCSHNERSIKKPLDDANKLVQFLSTIWIAGIQEEVEEGGLAKSPRIKPHPDTLMYLAADTAAGIVTARSFSWPCSWTTAT